MQPVAASLIPGHAMEVNFTIKKFMELPDAERRRIYDALHGEDEETKVRAAFDILKLLTEAPPDELTEYANAVLGTEVSGYFIWPDQENLVSRAIWLTVHFTDHLKLDGEAVSIDLIIPVKPPNRPVFEAFE